MNTKRDLSELEETISYKFKNRETLKLALTHSSYTNEHAISKNQCNERMEFLGDSILGFCVAKFLFSKEPTLAEGNMTKLRADLVCERNLYATAKKINLGEYLLLGSGEALNGGRDRPSICADAVEALMCAVYIDGGLAEAERVIGDLILSNYSEHKNLHADAKTRLQELVQSKHGYSAKYTILSETGPDHSRMFVAEAEAFGKSATGEGRTKKAAEQEAARKLLKIIGGD